MEVCLSTLGVTLPIAFQGRRKLVLKQASCSSSSTEPVFSSNSLSECHRDSLLVMFERSLEKTLSKPTKSLHYDQEKEDDDTASTQSLTTSSESDDEYPVEQATPSRSRLVSFAEPVVTEIHYRPYTTKAEKYALFYDEYDYSDFKIAFITGRSPRTRKVSFSHDIVSHVHVFKGPSRTLRNDLYYSEPELQR